MRKIIFDVDTGVDDALAIAYLMAQKDVEVLGITTGFGNVYARQAYENSVNLLAALGRGDVPVYRGAENHLNGTPYQRQPVNIRIHGQNGIGEAVLPQVKVAEPEIMADDFIIECCEKYGCELTIVAVGAQTNLVHALQKNPAAMAKAGRFVVMGGALTVRGNVNHYAEANFHRDVDATKVFMESGLPITMVGLDVTLRTAIGEKEINSWKTVDNVAAKALYDMSKYYYTNEGDSAKEMYGCLHDPLAIEVAVNPDIITQYIDCDLLIEADGPDAGRCVLHPDKLATGGKTTRVCLDVKAREFVDKFTSDIYNLIKNL